VEDDERLALGNAAHRPIAATLTEQRRMDPAIASVVSEAFYGGNLKTETKRAEAAETALPPFIHLPPLPTSPVVVVNYAHISSTGNRPPIERGKPRWHNPSEVESVLDVLRHIRARDGSDRPTLAILSPYKAQVDKLQHRVAALRGHELAHLDKFAPVRANHDFVGTVDSFQGSEADMVILSLVRNNGRTGVGALGFLRDRRRMNVALSRAKSQLIIVGSLTFLQEAVDGVNPDAEPHDLSFLTKIVETIGRLTGQRRGNGAALATIISPLELKVRK
jgi:superfamily I DNA and/or RNA helicase